jgi:uncharacterized membrane protein YfcA
VSPLVIVLCGLCVFAGGAVKGVAALGLPLVAIPLLTLVVGLKNAVGLMVLPMIGSNLIQSFQGGLLLATMRRYWLLTLTLLVFSALGTQLLVAVPQRALEIGIGSALIILPIALHFRPELRIEPHHRRWSDPFIGILSGLLGGISAYYGPPLMIYVLGLRLPKNEFVAAISLFYWVAGLGLLIGIYGTGVADLKLLGLSAAMLVPMALGLWLGQIIQFRLSEATFRRVLMAIYLATGASFLLEGIA